MTNMDMNAVSTKLVTTLMVCILIDGKEILPHVLRNEDVTKRVLMSWTYVEPRCVQALNESTSLVTYSSGKLADEIGPAAEKIEDWFGKPLVITCDEVTTAQIPQVIEQVHHTTGVESVMFNTRTDDMQCDSNHSVQSGYLSYAGGPAVLGAPGTTILNKIPSITPFTSIERGKRHRLV